MTSQRNTAPMLQSPRCGARTRANGTCRAPAVRGKRRCRMHGGAAGSGAPRGNRNALKHGVFTKEARERRAHLSKLMREANRLLKELS
jgi:glucans biosynthesis protein